ncbi:protein precursor [Mytilinidion resinicola]|uniref:Protein n=1 Tax=Mytilinidion resinicola TaxID=574789 RepID=A0A6A6YRL6_9PEZI|nr:protein precursor [Mytilinidion resinicola]KAF2811169.1 protein precursor [Mytilinidion resinicola]
MSYIAYSTYLFLLLLILSTTLYYTRGHWSHRLPTINLPNPFPHLYQRLPSSFTGDIEAGLSSSSFNLSENVEAGDSRAGLDDKAKKEVQAIMTRQRVGFDEARRLWVQEGFRRNGIGADGRPRDPKFVSFS